MFGIGIPRVLQPTKSPDIENSSHLFNPHLFGKNTNCFQNFSHAPMSVVPNFFHFGTFAPRPQKVEECQKGNSLNFLSTNPEQKKCGKLGHCALESNKICNEHYKLNASKCGIHQDVHKVESGNSACALCDVAKKTRLAFRDPLNFLSNLRSIAENNHTLNPCNQSFEPNASLMHKLCHAKEHAFVWPAPTTFFSSYSLATLSQLMISQAMNNKLNSFTPKNPISEKLSPSDFLRSGGESFTFSESWDPNGRTKRKKIYLDNTSNFSPTETRSNKRKCMTIPTATNDPWISSGQKIASEDEGKVLRLNTDAPNFTSQLCGRTISNVDANKVSDSISPINLTSGSTTSLRGSSVKSTADNSGAGATKEKKSHRCMYCGKLYSRKYGLKIHIRTHTGYKPLKCKVCGRPFGDPSNLNKHVRLHAEGETPYRCEFCGKVLVRRRDLERHIKSRHPEKCHPLFSDAEVVCPPADPRLWNKS